MVKLQTLINCCLLLALVPLNQATLARADQREPLPGEEVVTSTGKKMKVWSTEGPVKVSPPPQPFDDPHKSTLDGVGVLVDQRQREAREKERVERERWERHHRHPSPDPSNRQFLDPPLARD